MTPQQKLLITSMIEERNRIRGDFFYWKLDSNSSSNSHLGNENVGGELRIIENIGEMSNWVASFSRDYEYIGKFLESIFFFIDFAYDLVLEQDKEIETLNNLLSDLSIDSNAVERYLEIRKLLSMISQVIIPTTDSLDPSLINQSRSLIDIISKIKKIIKESNEGSYI